MRIRNSRNPIDVLATICSDPSSPSVVLPLCSVEKPQAAAPEVGVCLVNQSPWDVTPLVLAFFRVDGLLHHHDGDCHRQKASAQDASASKERNGGSRSDPLSPSISSFKSAGKDGRKGKGKQGEKRSEALCFKSDGSAPEPTTIRLSLQKSRRRAAKKGEGSAAAKDSRSGGVKGGTCKREDGKGWRCSNEAAPGSSLCEHHLSQVRSYCKRPSTDSRGGAEKLQASTRADGGEGRRKRPMSSLSMGSFYYYTGFGPAWRETKRKRVSAVAEDDGHTVEEDEEADDDDGDADGDDDEDGGRKGKSRGRKRVKCRSLKSLL